MPGEVPLEPTSSDDGIGPIDIYQPGGYVLPRAYRPDYKRVLELPIHDDDVWVISYPKTGTTWVVEMVWLLRNNLNFEEATQNIEERVPFIEYSSLIMNRMDEEQREEHKKTQPLLFSDSVRHVAEMSGPRTIKTHLQWSFLPRDLKRPDSKGKIIYIAREAKDVCVSFYYHTKMIHSSAPATLEEFAEYFLADRTFFAPFWTHLVDFWELRDRQNILFLKFEDMKKDLPSVIRQVNAFLNLPPLNNEKMEKLCHHLSFQNMRNNKAVNSASAIRQSRKPDERGEGHFIRKGIVGDWKEKMSPDMVRRFNEWTEKQIRGSTLTF